jgi:hypothetical protein
MVGYTCHTILEECPLFFGWKIIRSNNLVNVSIKKILKKKNYDINKIVIFKIPNNIFDKVTNKMFGNVYL